MINIELQEQEPTNLLVLHKAIKSYEKRNCLHKSIAVNSELAQVECKDCGEKLDPLAILVRMSEEQTLWWHRASEYRSRYEEYMKLDQELAHKHRCKCEHCHKMTRIDRRISELKVVK